MSSKKDMEHNISALVGDLTTAFDGVQLQMVYVENGEIVRRDHTLKEFAKIMNNENNLSLRDQNWKQFYLLVISIKEKMINDAEKLALIFTINNE